jgi:hypothetical protein
MQQGELIRDGFEEGLVYRFLGTGLSKVAVQLMPRC